MPVETPLFTGDGITLFTDEKNATALRRLVDGEPTVAGYHTAHLSRLGAGDSFALLAYIEMNEAHERAVQAMRVAVRLALDGPGLQGGTEHGRVPADHVR